MEPLPLIPCIQNAVIPEMGYLVREVFQDAFQADTEAWSMSMNFSKSRPQNSWFGQIAAQIQADVIDHRGILEALDCAEVQIMESRGYHLCRDHRIALNRRAMEIIRLKRYPVYIDLHPNIVEKYPLLQSDDLLPPTHDLITDFRLDGRDRLKMKQRLYKSRDSLLDESLLPTMATRVCRFGATMEQKSRKKRTKETSITRMASRTRSIIRADYLKTVLVAKPEELFFHNFEHQKIYKKTVLVTNISNSMARYKIEARSSNSKFTVFRDTGAVETQEIAPGMQIKLTVLFKCDISEDPEEFLIVNVQSGKTLCIKMYGYRDPPLLRAVTTIPRPSSFNQFTNMSSDRYSTSLSSIFERKRECEVREEQLTEAGGRIKQSMGEEKLVITNLNYAMHFECGKCFVGDGILVSTKFINNGSNGRFFVMSEIDWCTMNIDDIVDCNMILIPPFAVWPVYFELKNGESVEFQIYFSPESYGMQVDKLYILCDNHGVHSIELIGDGITYESNFIHFSDEITPEKTAECDDKSFDTFHLNMGIVESKEMTKNTFSVTNTSGLKMCYRWERYMENSSNSQNTWKYLPIENLMIQPNCGTFCSNSQSFEVIIQTKDLEPSEYRINLRLYVEDIPLAAIPKDSILPVTECYVKRRNCAITVDVLVSKIEIRIDLIPKEVALNSGIVAKSEDEMRWAHESEEINVNNTRLLSSSLSAIQYPHPGCSTVRENSLICRVEGTECDEVQNTVRNVAILDVMGDSVIDEDAPTLHKLDSRCQTENAAILMLDRAVYVGMKQTYRLTLRNLICKPVSYMWDKPPANDGCVMKITFNPEKGLIPPNGIATIEVICLPVNTGKLDNYFIPCFVGDRQDPIILKIECTVSALYVTFLFLPPPSVTVSPCVDSAVRVEWNKDGHASTLALNNLNIDENSNLEEELELRNINLDVGQIVANVATGSALLGADNVSQIFPSQTVSSPKQMDDHSMSKAKYRSGKSKEQTDHHAAESPLRKTEPLTLRSWDSLLKGIIWTKDRPDEFILLEKPQSVVPYHKTIVPPIMQALTVEFLNLPLQMLEKRTFVIRNETPAESTYSINLKRFGGMDIVSEAKPTDVIDVTYATAMGHRSDNYWEKIMPPGQGIVMTVEPMNGKLSAYETVPIDIYVYTDTWGVYVDEITISIPGLPDYIFGVCIQVVGSPVAYPMCKYGRHKLPTLRFGAVSLSREKVTRKIQVENTSTVPIILNWCTYLMNPQLSGNSIPFNIVLQMHSPFTDEIATTGTNLTNTCNDIKISKSRLTTSGSQQSKPDPDERASARFSLPTNTSSSCYRSDTKVRATMSCPTYYKCWSGDDLSSDQILPEYNECVVQNSIQTEKLNVGCMECITESETDTVGWTNHTSERETDLELTITPYYGEPDFSVFTVSPAEIILTSKQRRSIDVTLNVANYGIKKYESEIRGCLKGFIRVAPMHKYRADSFSRSDGAMLTPTEIQLEATIVQPKLFTKVTEDDRTFRIFTSSSQKEMKEHRKYVFYNNTGEPMFINAQSTDPFQVLTLCTSKTTINPSESDGISVTPGHSVEVNLICVIDADWIDQAMKYDECKDIDTSFIDVEKNLVIQHIGTCNQVLSLYLRIYLPLLKLSTCQINFGVVYIGETKQVQLSIENVSKEEQIMRIRAKQNNGDFVVLPDQGSVHQGGTFDAIITFSPSNVGKSDEVLDIFTSVPNYAEKCFMEGYGSWDHETVYHRDG